MRRTLTTSLALMLAGTVALQLGVARSASAELQDPQEPAAQQEFPRFTAEQLDNLVAPVALYADPLLAQVLLAATFPDQISAAAAYVRANGTDSIDDQAWDVSVKAVAHYPTVLNTLDTRMDWTTSLGQAYAAQSTDVMRAVQRMRRMAEAQGNLVSSPEQQVVAEDEYIRIWPAQPRVMYVPVYDPAVIFVRPIFVRPGWHAFFSFGVPFPIGAWLIYDWDWPSWRIVYTGWNGGGWIGRSRPYVRITNVYINPRYQRVWYDRDVLRRRPDYGRVGHYEAIHPGVGFGDRRGAAGPERHAVPRGQGGPPSQASSGNPSRHAVPRQEVARGQAGVDHMPRPLPVASRPADARARAAMEVRPAVELPRSAPVEARSSVGRSRPVVEDARPTVDRPQQEWVESRPALDRPRSEDRGSAPERSARPRGDGGPQGGRSAPAGQSRGRERNRH
jgi:hypothetical protein